MHWSTVERARSQHDRLTLVDTLEVEEEVRTGQQRWNRAEAALDEALTLARQIPYPYAEARLLFRYGDLLVTRSQLDWAHDQYVAALAILRPLGEVLYTKRIEQALVEMSHH